jgi:lipoprotein NlpI
LEGALADFDTALQLEPDNHPVHYARGLATLQLGRIEDAKASIARAALALEAPPGLHLLHAVLAYAMGDHDGASVSLNRYQQLVPEQQNSSAIYLTYLLPTEEADALPKDAVCRYFLGELNRKETLDAFGFAESPEQARQQICAAAFWMAQWERAQDATEKSRELLKISIHAGQADFTEYQLAKWQWDM